MQIAHELLGREKYSEYDDAVVEREQQELLAADLVFCPNRFVTASVQRYGVPPERCIDTSYGWGPDRLRGNTRVVPPASGLTVAFAGTIDVRKGAPWVLEAWARANVGGRLLLAGNIDLWVKERYAGILARPDVHLLGHVEDVGAVYRSADIFVFPTWAEGGPMVTVEALALGLPVVTTPMGTGGFFGGEDDVGIIVEPGDTAAIADAFRRFADDRSLVRAMGSRAAVLARRFTWDLVGRGRTAALRDHRNRHLLGDAVVAQAS
jgi:glycosyltransferase involved in cell wall biosynthesis